MFYINYQKKLNQISKGLNFEIIEKLFNRIKKIKKNNKILIFGNGAGAAIASHFSNDLSNTMKIKTLSFDNSAHITCFSNDYGYENWVKKTIDIFSNNTDLIILLSASGNSKNMINAAKYCKKKNIEFYSITGFKRNNQLNKNSKNYIWINSSSYNQIELTQQFILLSIIDKLNIEK